MNCGWTGCTGVHGLHMPEVIRCPSTAFKNRLWTAIYRNNRLNREDEEELDGHTQTEA